LPEGLTLVHPYHNYVLATLKGSRQYEREDAAEDAKAPVKAVAAAAK
jgi:hypothetical protein